MEYTFKTFPTTPLFHRLTRGVTLGIRDHGTQDEMDGHVKGSTRPDPCDSTGWFSSRDVQNTEVDFVLKGRPLHV